MFKKIQLLFSTIHHLKWIQVKYQIINRLKKPKPLLAYHLPHSGLVTRLHFEEQPPVVSSYSSHNKFYFLNRKKQFPENIDWNFKSHGELWRYNLQYGNYWLQDDLRPIEKWGLLKSLYSALFTDKLALEPYPASLRIMNAIRLYDLSSVLDGAILQNIYSELHFLSQHLEYHLLGNHFLENLFALFMGSAFFNNEKWHNSAKFLLHQQLEEQVLADGAHFELSPMYHQLMFFRVLELIDWYSTYQRRDKIFLGFCRDKAELMRAWLENISFENGDIPLFNDAAKGIAHPTGFLLAYGDKLAIQSAKQPLNESGYRSFKNEVYEIKVDFAAIGAPYQPGHAHADALSFILYHRGKPLFVEQGTSTYAIGKQRDLERSTQAHNTVVVNDTNQSEVWASFRVGKRAKTTILNDKPRFIKASHDGYQKSGVVHTRSFEFLNDNLHITDNLSNGGQGVFYLHLAPNCKIDKVTDADYIINKKGRLVFENFTEVHREDYDYAEDYHLRQKAKRFVVPFSGNLKVSFYFC